MNYETEAWRRETPPARLVRTGGKREDFLEAAGLVIHSTK